MKRKEHEAQEPRHIQEYVEVTSAAQRSDSPAQAINQRFRKHDGSLIVISGPSGAGKSAITRYALLTLPDIRFSISYTTRAPRSGERDGSEYFFIDRPKFESLIDAGEFLEWAEVHGNYYGTSRNFIEGFLRQGIDVILDIDVQGARSIKKACPEAVAVFVLPPSFEILRERLVNRGLDDAGVIERRLKIAHDEISHCNNYDYLIVNDDLENAEKEFVSIIVGVRCRTISRKNVAASILENFGGIDVQNT
jgi:guanylate kinase